MRKTVMVLSILTLAACSQKPAQIVLNTETSPQSRPTFGEKQPDMPFTPVFGDVRQSQPAPVQEIAIKDLTPPEKKTDDKPLELAKAQPVIITDPAAKPNMVVAEAKPQFRPVTVLGAPRPHFRPEAIKVSAIIEESDNFKPFSVRPKLNARNKFIWPVSGKVISRFGPKSGGLYNDGVNIAAPAGTPIHASMNGEVVYEGDDLPNYGNLLIIRHKNGLLSAYAHTSKILVHKGDKVKLGQVVAEVGQTGNVQTPQVHFAIREGKKPLDPMLKVRG